MTTESDEGNGRHRDDLTEEENAIRAAELEKLSEIDFSKVTGDFDDKVEEVIDDNLIRLLSGGEDCINYSAGNGNVTDGRKGNTGRRATTKEENGRYEYVQKYSISETVLAEAVIIDQKAFFAVSDFTYSTDIKLTLQKEIRLDDDRRTVLKPLDLISYINKPYRFKSKEEFWDNIKRAKEQTLDALYSSVKAIWKIYVDADNFHIRICSADTTFTYKQDRVGSTHYLFFVGDNDSGKSANLTIIDYLAYRTMCSVGITSSNIYQFLGSRDEGVGTICEDEADNIDKDTEKMRLYKSGYTKGKVVPKTDTTYSRTQYKFNAYCFKALAAERLPS